MGVSETGTEEGGRSVGCRIANPVVFQKAEWKCLGDGGRFYKGKKEYGGGFLVPLHSETTDVFCRKWEGE